MLTKEEVIILRTIFLEFGDDELRQKRFEFPYENMGYEEEDGQRKANLGVLIDDLKSFGKPEIDDIVFNFYLMRGAYTPDSHRLVIVNGKQHGVDWDNDTEGIELRDSMICLKNISESGFFMHFRMGLYYKSIPNHDKAVEHLKTAHQIYSKTLNDTIYDAFEKHTEFLSQFYNFDKKASKEQYSPEKHGPLPEVELSPELRVSIEERPSFHLGEIYLDMAEKYWNDWQNSPDLSLLDVSKANYAKAIDYFEETDKWHRVLHYHQFFDDSPFNELSRFLAWLKEFDVIRFPLSPFKRNCYWEVNYTNCKNQLHRIEEEKFISAIKLIEKPDQALIDREVSKALSEERRKREETEKNLRLSIEKLVKYEAIISDPGSISLPTRVLVKLEEICRESRESFCWISKHFRSEGLKYLKQFKEEGKPRQIKILAGPENIDDHFEKCFESFKKEMEAHQTRVEMRIVCPMQIIDEMHDRWIITDDKAYHVPPVGSIVQRQTCSITEEKDRGIILDTFNGWWRKAEDILTGDRAEIMRARDALSQRKRKRQ